jgi:NADPH-dependent glutamate synthase beta subunit-like oxidoreductase
VIVYRRTRERMPALDFEVEEALEEGVLVKWLSTIKQAGDGELTIEKMVLDDKGNPQPTGELETLKADSLVLPWGRTSTSRPARRACPAWWCATASSRSIPNDDDRPPGLFAGGDMVPADRNVTVAIGHGKKAARHIDAWLRGTRISRCPNMRRRPSSA